MKTSLIPRDEWKAFFEGFGRRHEGWRVMLEVLGSDMGAQIEARELALEGITVALEDGKEGEIEIMVGASAGDHITHNVIRPVEVGLEQTDEGADAALAIKSEDGRTTLLSFRSPALPETVDGIVLAVEEVRLIHPLR